MKNKYNKGITLVEIMVSIALISVIVLFIFSILIDLKREYNGIEKRGNDSLTRATAIRIVENDIIEKKLKKITYDQNNYTFTLYFNDDSSNKLEIGDKYIAYGNEFKEVWNFENGEFDRDNIELYSQGSNITKFYLLRIYVPFIYSNNSNRDLDFEITYNSDKEIENADDICKTIQDTVYAVNRCKIDDINDSNVYLKNVHLGNYVTFEGDKAWESAYSPNLSSGCSSDNSDCDNIGNVKKEKLKWIVAKIDGETITLIHGLNEGVLNFYADEGYNNFSNVLNDVAQQYNLMEYGAIASPINENDISLITSNQDGVVVANKLNNLNFCIDKKTTEVDSNDLYTDYKIATGYTIGTHKYNYQTLYNTCNADNLAEDQSCELEKQKASCNMMVKIELSGGFIIDANNRNGSLDKPYVVTLRSY